MKKILCVFIVTGLFMLTCFAYGEEFTLHNGVQFGMSKENALELEATAGVTFEETTDGTNYFPDGILRIESEPTTVAGRENSIINYFFNSNGEINSMVYFAWDFLEPPIENDKVITTLMEKYGDPVAMNDSLVDVEGEAYDTVDVFINYNNVHPKDNPDITLFYQWICPMDTGYVDIQIMMVDLNVYRYRVISYAYRTEEEMSNMKESINREKQVMNDDL